MICPNCKKKREEDPCEHCGDDNEYVLKTLSGSGDFKEDEITHQSKSDGTSED